MAEINVNILLLNSVIQPNYDLLISKKINLFRKRAIPFLHMKGKANI